MIAFMTSRKMERKISTFRILAIFCLTVLIFILGILASNITTNIKVTDINKVQDDLKNELLSMELEDRLLEEVSCSNATELGSFSGKLNDLATKLNYLESEYEKNDPKIIELKKPYTLLLIRNYLRLRDVVEKCGYDYKIILYFYSNEDDKIDLCEKQGFVLDYLQKKYGYNYLKVFAFDTGLDLPVVRTLMDISNIEVMPSLVIDQKLYAGFHEKDEIEGIITAQ